MNKAPTATVLTLPPQGIRGEGLLSALPVAWLLLAAEMSLALFLLLSDRLPPVLTRGLQLFLSF